MKELEKAINYYFNNQNLLLEALSHPSLRQHVTKNAPSRDYERLELLGDSIIGFVITEIIFKNYSNFDEGKLAKIKAYLVCKDMLCKVADTINLANYIIMTHGEEASGGRLNPNNIENTMEALIAAIYLDSNIDTVKLVIKDLWSDFLFNIDLSSSDPKTALQELSQSIDHNQPIYEVIQKEGSAHSPIFTVLVRVNQYEQKGQGRSVKAAEKDAAEKLLKLLEKSLAK
jgi:ribonuclease III